MIDGIITEIKKYICKQGFESRKFENNEKTIVLRYVYGLLFSMRNFVWLNLKKDICENHAQKIEKIIDKQTNNRN